MQPCTSRGNRKPCADWILEKSVSTVFIGMLDPNPRVYTESVSKLRRRGIEVGYFPEHFRREIELDNASFIAQFSRQPCTHREGTIQLWRQRWRLHDRSWRLSVRNQVDQGERHLDSRLQRSTRHHWHCRRTRRARANGHSGRHCLQHVVAPSDPERGRVRRPEECKRQFCCAQNLGGPGPTPLGQGGRTRLRLLDSRRRLG